MHLDTISVGNYTKLFYDNGTAWAEVQRVNTLPAPTDEASIVAVQEYGKKYQQQLVGSRTASNIELVINWIPKDPTHIDLAALYEDSTVTRFYIEYTDAVGVDKTFLPFEATVSSGSLSSEFDAVRTKTHTLAIASGLGAISEEAPKY